jgi:hypothetical protein
MCSSSSVRGPSLFRRDEADGQCKGDDQSVTERKVVRLFDRPRDLERTMDARDNFGESPVARASGSGDSAARQSETLAQAAWDASSRAAPYYDIPEFRSFRHARTIERLSVDSKLQLGQSAPLRWNGSSWVLDAFAFFECWNSRSPARKP